ncbi:MAG TPA: formate/nitrite transporter family protein [Gemmatimonadaceae bacterium]|nr:formate/nitrite transporter family protein [Gemmatimonadaceae bacterium]
MERTETGTRSVAVAAETGEQKQIEEAKTLDAKTAYEVIREEGESELQRSTAALFWSGLAAGLSMGFSFLAEGLLRAHLPDAEWRPLVAKLGYTVGFVVVIIGSQQLFTENTLTPILPLLTRRTMDCLRNVLRLWGAVLVANLLGALLFALAVGRLAVVEPRVQRALSDIARDSLRFDVPTTLLHAVFAGWLIALMVWMLPAVKGGRLGVIVLMTYLVGLGGFAHVIAGASEVFFAAVRGETTWHAVLLGFMVPTLVGNILGGVTLVTALNHAQATKGESGG